MNLFGISLVGADICGFALNSTAELCGRWMQLGSLYPFARNHNSVGQSSQEPYSFNKQVTDISRDALNRRYTLLNYLYGLFWRSHIDGTPVWRALSFEFYYDNATYDIDTQFFVGPALLVSPALKQSQTMVNAYFPNGRFYDFYNYSRIDGPTWRILDAPFEKINIHIRAGAVFAKFLNPQLTTKKTIVNDMEVIVPLTKGQNALGQLIFDDGESLNPQTQTSLIFISAQKNIVTSHIYANGYDLINRIERFTILGINQKTISVVLVNRAITPFTFDATLGVLRITGLSLNPNVKFEIEWV